MYRLVRIPPAFAYFQKSGVIMLKLGIISGPAEGAAPHRNLRIMYRTGCMATLAGALALWVAAVEGLLALALRRAPQGADWGVGAALVLTVGLAVAASAALVGARRTT